MDKEDLFKLAQCTSDDDAQAPEEVVKGLLGVAAKGKPAAIKEMSDWLINRLGESESARVKLKVLRLMMQIMSSKKGTKFKAQLRQDAEAILRSTTSFETQVDPEHGDKPMLFVRKSAVKCLALLELPTEPAPSPSAAKNGTSAASTDLAQRKRALEQRKAALAKEQAAATSAAASPPAPASTVAKEPVAKAPVAKAAPQPVAALESAPESVGGAASTGDDIGALVQARVDAAMSAIAPKIAAAEQVTVRMDKLERIVQEKIAETRRETLQTQERLAVAEHELTERLEQLQASTAGGNRLSEVEERLRKTVDDAAKAMTEGGEAGLAALHAVKLDEMAARLTAAESASLAAATESRAKCETLGGLLLQLRKRANATEEDGLRLSHTLQQYAINSARTLVLEERLETAKKSLSTEIATVGTSAATASANSAGQAVLEEQMAALDRKFSEANEAQAAWLERQLVQSSQDASVQISAVELNVQAALLDGEGKAMDAVTKLETSLASTAAGIKQNVAGLQENVAGVDERISVMEEGMEAGIGDRCDELQEGLDQCSAIILAMKGGQDQTRDKLAMHEAQLEEFEATRQIVEESVEVSSGDIDLLKQEFTTFTQTVQGTTESMSSLVARMLATEEENYDTVLAEANLSSVVEYNRAASRRLIKLTKTVERLADKVETCNKGQQKSWQAISEMQGRMQTIRDTVVRMTR